MVSQLLLPSWKWNGIHVCPGDVFSDTCATDSMEPRRDETRTMSPSEPRHRTCSAR